MSVDTKPPPVRDRLPRVADRHLGWSKFGDRFAKYFVGVVIVVVLAYVLLPLVTLAGASFNSPPSLSFPPEHWSLASYGQISELMYTSFVNSVELAVAATLTGVVLALPAAFGIVRGLGRRGRTFLEVVFKAPLQAPQLILGVGLYILYINVSRPIATSFAGLFFAHIILVSPYILSTLVVQVAKLDTAQEEAAAGLGASPLRIAVTVLLPNVRQAIIAAAILSFLVSFDNLPLSLFLQGANNPTLPVVLFDTTLISLTPTLYAAATLTVLVSLLITFVLDRLVGLRRAFSP